MGENHRNARRCPRCVSTHLVQEIVEDFLSDAKTINFRCQNCKYEWSEDIHEMPQVSGKRKGAE